MEPLLIVGEQQMMDLLLRLSIFSFDFLSNYRTIVNCRRTTDDRSATQAINIFFSFLSNYGTIVNCRRTTDDRSYSGYQYFRFIF